MLSEPHVFIGVLRTVYVGLLDVAFAEDSSRAYLKNAQATWVALRHLAINLLEPDRSVKAGVEAKRLRAGWDRSYLFKLLAS
ncbi:hypothetical protein BH24DEI2_BH24DEI2_03370 [soil metagenome]